jgi:hypothetical protein
MKEPYGLLADLVVVIHLLYVLFAAGGLIGILLGAGFKWGWVRNRRFRIIHLVAVGLVALEAASGIVCPLTAWEYNLRRMAGETVDKDLSFVARLIHSAIFYDFPGWVFTVIHILFGLLVVITFVLLPPRFHREKPMEGRPNTEGGSKSRFGSGPVD